MNPGVGILSNSIISRDPNVTPPLAQAVPLGLQHVLAMFASNVTPSIIIAGAAGFAFGSVETVYLVQMAMLFAGVATLFQTVGFGPVGARLPIMQGTSFAFVSVLATVAATQGTLTTDRLLSPEGGGLRDYRKNLARAERREAGYRLANNAGDLAVIADLSAIWARAHGEALSGDDPTAAVLSMIGARRAPVHALILEEQGTPQGYMFWEETDLGRRHANSLGGVSIGGKGLSEFGFRAMAEVLDQRGFKTICIGGSETESLDAFKRKLAPIQSTPLVSAICGL